ncbi:hypothetical protein C5167_048741 [Papaver somniferum]|uniref:NAD-dependent epimerase/dehydratase domain-containing protein n=1 Tax=Papaver somniferum TaxID=3469 RepID=A0A4Y7KN05_PAPSO|nr:hypothetical protein C5167_048741 [Papaver somniferum]
MDENSWSDVEFCRDMRIHGSSYIIPKTLIEQATLKFGEDNGLDVVSIIPPLVVGPFTCPHLPGSISVSLAMILGTKYGLGRGFEETLMVHIDDVVSGHIFLFECPNAKGRYICSSAETSVYELARLISTNYPDIQMPSEFLDETRNEKSFHLSTKKLLNLGFKFKYNLKDMVDGAVQSCKQKGFL